MLEDSLFIGATKDQGNWIVGKIMMYSMTCLLVPILYTAVVSVFKPTMPVDGVSTIKCAAQHQLLVCQ
jgi:hypothetical protein